LSEREEALAKQIVDAAYTVHRKLGPGLLEKVYEICFCHELSKKGIKSRRQEEMNPVWEAQVLSYLKSTGKRLGFVINFNVPLIRDGIKRIIL